MKLEEIGIPGVILARPQVHEDDRGWFMEILREEVFNDTFVQSNHSHSRANVLRGLHFHANQSDAWYVASGSALVGLADLRERSERPRVAALELDGDDRAVLYIPPGVAHGFYAATELDLIYYVTNYFDNSDEHGVIWNDPALAVPWGDIEPVLSERDREAPGLDWAAVSTILQPDD